MKILHLKRRLAALLAAIGMVPASWVWSAELQTNLVVNPSFEVVDEGETGEFGSVRLLDWDDIDGDDDDTFAYAYSQNYSGTPNPPGAGDYHFMGGANTLADEPIIAQLVQVGSGPSAALIASGKARYDLRAFFSSYRGQDEANRVRLRFLSGNNELGTLKSAAPNSCRDCRSCRPMRRNASGDRMRRGAPSRPRRRRSKSKSYRMAEPAGLTAMST